VPATTQAPPDQQKPTQAQLTAAAITALGAAVTVAGVVAALRALFRSAGIGTAALSAVTALILSWVPDSMEGTGPATHWAIRTNAQRRAQYFLAACKRVQAAAVDARSKGEPVKDAILAAIATERRYLTQMAAMAHQRVKAASAVDGLAAMHGDLLGWNSVLDPRCTPECRAANGKSFYADRPPLIGYPGASHPGCRCFPGPPRRGAPVLP
jgi:hypothetical protein